MKTKFFDNEVGWLALYFGVPFFILRLLFELRGTYAAEPLMSSGLSALVGIALGVPIFFLMRNLSTLAKFFTLLGLLVAGVVILIMYGS
ncbi:hypothetical protein [Pontibacter sp. G13]|uniref:hypothetical protein n=1 Tax=Pontibacter sp. G13 TaxID=3074898 RepID=UPI00288BA9DF|nr:hypothetical protein [Pontibacter sp. G13]WNJ19982.1 hypothetical protein RJD25_05820 [Pontibacter sp. G13]